MYMHTHTYVSHCVFIITIRKRVSLTSAADFSIEIEEKKRIQNNLNEVFSVSKTARMYHT